MMSTRRKRVILVCFLVALLSVGVVALAWACTFAATLDLDRVRVQPGDSVVATGDGYDPLPTSSDVQLSLTGNGIEPRVLGTADVQLGYHWHGSLIATSASIEQELLVPDDIPPGTYVIVAEQHDLSGHPVPGTPARATLLVEALL